MPHHNLVAADCLRSSLSACTSTAEMLQIGQVECLLGVAQGHSRYNFIFHEIHALQNFRCAPVLVTKGQHTGQTLQRLCTIRVHNRFGSYLYEGISRSIGH
jgi:hypothetical protein